MTALSTKQVVMCGLFIALDIILARVFVIQTLTLRIGFAFVPIALCAIMFGPLIGGIAAVIADLLGVVLFPMGFNIGFTISAFLTGAAYGVFLYKKPKSFKNILIPVLIVCLFINLCLDTVWLTFMYEKGFLILLPERLFKAVLMIPIQIIVLSAAWKSLGNTLETFAGLKRES